MNNAWYLRSRRRYFLDFHIDGWDETFLSQFDPEEFAEACQQGGATAVTFMANTHSGLLNWPSALGGTPHPIVQKGDLLQQTLDAIHRRGMDAIVYYVFVYVEDYWNKHPEARTVLPDGTAPKSRVCFPPGAARFATCCINDPGYHDRALGELAELCERYDFEGVWPDMTFWPAVCCCENCRRRYRRETGREIPRIIDWKDPEFVRFVRARQRWLAEFDAEVTRTVKDRKPGMKLAQQSQTFTWDWMAGASAELADCWDWMSADLYCDRYGLSFSSKLFYALSTEKPFERINCWNVPNIHEHVITKTADEMRMIAYATIMNDGALTVIDQIDPVGTVHKRNYRMMKGVFRAVEPYEPYLGGRFVRDVGVYYSLYSNFDQSWNGRPLADTGFTFEYGKENPAYQQPTAHLKCAANAAKTLAMYHVPYGVVTKKNLRELSDYRCLILSNVAMLDEEEVAAIRSFVKNGGSLYASRETATIDAKGFCSGEFLLAELFGVSRKGQVEEHKTYLSPTKQGERLFPQTFSPDFPLTIDDGQTVVEAGDDCEILGTLTLPYDCPAEDRYASMLTSPPGRFTPSPALVLHRYGKGMVAYSGALLELGEHISQREVFYRLIRRLTGSFCTELEHFPSVEITRFEKQGRTYLHLLNFQAELPNLPIAPLTFRFRPEGSVKSIMLLPERKAVDFSAEEDGSVKVTLERLEDYALLCVEY